MKDFVKSFFASIFAILFLLAVVVGIAAIKATEKPTIKKRSYLVVDIYGEILPYYPPDDIMAEILGGQPETVHRILGNLEKAAVDDRIEGVIFKISSNNSLGSASIQEIRGAIANIREAGKKVYAYSDALNRKSLFLASACDSIYMPIEANVTFVGFGGTLMYVRGTLDKLGISPNLHRIDEYKSAAELVLREDMSPEAREMYTWIFDDLWESQIGAISEDRGIAEDQLVALMEKSIFSVPEAVEAGLVDRALYWDELDGMLKGDEAKLNKVYQKAYASVKRAKVGLKGDKKIAVVHAHGQIGGRKSFVDPVLGMIMGHETIAKELRRVLDDEDIDAVVFRVDSPGGETLASDLIAYQVERVSAEKPIVVSMMNVAASGGYTIAFQADKIVADPMTITGSIGSIFGKFNTKGLYNKLGITFDHITKGPNGLLWSEYTDFTDEQWERLKENHWAGYEMWLNDIADHRGIPVEELRELAKGKVWTGRQALENGLVDELGGLDRAIDVAKELAEIPVDEEVVLIHYPKKKSAVEIIFGGGGVKAAVRWMTYRFIREDLTQSLQLLAHRVYGLPIVSGE